MKKIFLKPFGVSLIDDDDYERVSKLKWYLSSQGYAIGGNKKHNNIKSFIKLHRFILNVDNPKIKVDHIDGDKLNNKKSNLRIATASQNVHNSKKRVNTKNKYKGVSFIKKLNLWQSRCRMNGGDFYLGVYKSEIAAAYAYNKKATELSEYILINNLPFEIDFLENKLINDLVTNKSDTQSIYKYIYFKNKSGRMKSGKWFIHFKKDNKRYHKGYFFEEIDAKNYLINNYKHIVSDAGVLK